jgi:hypothetical protein
MKYEEPAGELSELLRAVAGGDIWWMEAVQPDGSSRGRKDSKRRWSEELVREPRRELLRRRPRPRRMKDRR